jgi:hypothetical protein
MQLYRRLLKSLLFMPLLALGLCQLLGAQSVWPGDPTENVAISRDGNQEQHPRIVSDGTNGAIIVWEYSTSTFGLDIMAQRVDAGGLAQVRHLEGKHIDFELH